LTILSKSSEVDELDSISSSNISQKSSYMSSSIKSLAASEDAEIIDL